MIEHERVVKEFSKEGKKYKIIKEKWLNRIFYNFLESYRYIESKITGFHSLNNLMSCSFLWSATLTSFYLYGCFPTFIHGSLQLPTVEAQHIVMTESFVSNSSLTCKVFTSNNLFHHPISFFGSPYHNHNYLVNYIVHLDIVFLHSPKCKGLQNRGLYSPALSRLSVLDKFWQLEEVTYF